MHILFVCTGNTCRSSMAEGILKSIIGTDPELAGAVTVSSAGISAYEGDTASANSVKAVQELWGIDINSHRARFLTSAEMDKADLILTMTRDHKRAIISMLPESRSKVHTLKEYVADKELTEGAEEYDFTLDIIDPYGMSPQFYKKCAIEIREAVDKLVNKLKKR